VLVLGGTGFVGRALLERLVRAHGGGSATIRVPTRRQPHANRIRHLPTVEVVQADVHDEATLRRLLAGMDAVVNLVAILHGSAAAFEHVHVALPLKLVAACRAAGVKRLVHVSALGIGDDADRASPAAATSQYLRSKAAGERAVRGSGLEWTVLRPSVIFGADDRFLNLFARLQRLAPVMPLAGGDARLQPVWVEDVAEAVVRALARPAAIGQVIECAGPREHTLSELVRLAGRWAGVERPQIALPMAVGRLQALALEMLPGEPLMSRDNLASLATPNVASGRLPGLASLDIEASALEAVAPLYLGAGFGRARLEPLRRVARRG
jgi:NADH dehydrogenase